MTGNRRSERHGPAIRATVPQSPLPGPIGPPTFVRCRRSSSPITPTSITIVASTRDKAERLRERIGAIFPQARLGRWHDELVGPHPQSMYQVAFPSEMLAAFVPWLMLNRDGLTILLHPETGNALSRSHRACGLVRRHVAVAP